MSRFIRHLCFLFGLLSGLSFTQAQQTLVNEDGASEMVPHLLDKEIIPQFDPGGADTFSADQLLPRISEEFQGALFICDPFCTVISQKLEDDWKPNLNTVKVHSQKMRLMDIDDPLYPILFPEKKQEAKNASFNRRRKRRERLAKDANVNEKAQKIKKEKEIKPPFKWAFDNGVRYYGGPRYTILDQTSDSTVQTGFKPKAGLININLGIGYFRGKPFGAYGYWVQPEVGYEMDFYKTKAKIESGADLEHVRTKMFVNLWFKQISFSWGPRYSTSKYAYNLSDNGLLAFGFEEDSKFLGLAIKYGRYRFDFDYGIGYGLNEKQPFRDQLQKSQQISVQGEYCRPSSRIAGKRYSPCYGLQYMTTTNTATFKPEINPTDTVSLSRQDIVLFANFYFGEDFLR